MSAADWCNLLGHFLTLSLLAIGGAITTAPEMHRFLVYDQHWITDGQFTSSIAIAQAAPGPNVIFIALLGWNVGLHDAAGLSHGAWMWGLFGAAVCMIATLLPSSLLTFVAARWGHRHRERLGVRAFKAAMAPIVIALITATGWILGSSTDPTRPTWHLWLITGITTLVVWRTRIHVLWLLGAGGLMGWLGWI